MLDILTQICYNIYIRLRNGGKYNKMKKYTNFGIKIISKMV